MSSLQENLGGDGRVAVITGGSGGIGNAIAHELAADNWHCVMLARGRERLAAAAAEIDAEWHTCDVSDRSEVETVAERIMEDHPKISMLVNSAGIPARSYFLEAEPELIEKVMKVNYLGAVWAVRSFLSGLEAAAPSDVVNVVSVAGAIVNPPSGPYSAAKHALLAFGRASEIELSKKDIQVHNILPAYVDTAGFPQQDKIEKGFKVLEPVDVAKAVMDAVTNNKREVFIPNPKKYRAYSVLQAMIPTKFTHGVDKKTGA